MDGMSNDMFVATFVYPQIFLKPKSQENTKYLGRQTGVQTEKMK